MKLVSRSVLAGLFLLAFLRPALAEEPTHPEEELSLRDLDGVVRELVVSPEAGGEQWLEAVVEPKAGGSLRFRLAPVEVMAEAEFALAVGHRVRLRFFTGETPAQVQRIRNQDTGRVLRLRCLHGQPLWPWGGGEHGDRGPYGSPRGGHGGPGGGSGGGSGL